MLLQNKLAPFGETQEMFGPAIMTNLSKIIILGIYSGPIILPVVVHLSTLYA